MQASDEAFISGRPVGRLVSEPLLEQLATATARQVRDAGRTNESPTIGRERERTATSLSA